MAPRFFEGLINTAFLNKLKRKLKEVQEYWKERLDQCENQAHDACAAQNPTLVKELISDKFRLVNLPYRFEIEIDITEKP